MQVRRRLFDWWKSTEEAWDHYATPADYAECRRLHRHFGTTYYFASRRFGSVARRRTDAVYGFVRVPDEWVDNPGELIPADQLRLLRNYRAEFIRGVDGVRPDQPVLRAFCDVVREVNMPLEEPLLFLDAMEMDLTQSRYETYADLQAYMRGSASAVGMMMCYVLNAPRTRQVHAAACALGEAMQLTNFLRDVGEDLVRGRLYLPQEDLARFGVTEQDLYNARVSPNFVSLMQFQIARARELYLLADDGIPLLPFTARKAVRMASVLYSRILDRIEEQGYDVFTTRARTSRREKLAVAARVLMS